MSVSPITASRAMQVKHRRPPSSTIVARSRWQAIMLALFHVAARRP